MAELVFDCIGARPGEQAVAPLLSLVLRVSETTGQRIDVIALRCQIRIEPAKRAYSAAEAEQLDDLFGDAARWAETLRPMQLATVGVDVPGFTGSTEIDLPILLSLDPQVGSTRYLAGLDSGDVPLLLLFSGTVFASSDGKASVEPVPWSKEASYQLPVQVWRDAIGAGR
jgi:Family of unknown function (DUF6084)